MNHEGFVHGDVLSGYSLWCALRYELEPSSTWFRPYPLFHIFHGTVPELCLDMTHIWRFPNMVDP